MLKAIAKLIFWLYGWKVDSNVPKEAWRCVMIAAPHTTNWDFVFARAAFEILGLPVRATVKKEFIRFPLKSLMLWLGAIPIDRSPKKPGEQRRSLTEAMVNLFEGKDHLAVMVTPEGTRSLRKEWKTGFYYVAKGAKVPIGLGYLDYKNKVAGVGGMIHPSGNMEADMQKIMAFYRNIPGKFPEKFSLDLRYLPSEETTG